MAKLNMFCSGFCTFACIKCIADSNVLGIFICASMAVLNLVFGIISGGNN